MIETIVTVRPATVLNVRWRRGFPAELAFYDPFTSNVVRIHAERADFERIIADMQAALDWLAEAAPGFSYPPLAPVEPEPAA